MGRQIPDSVIDVINYLDTVDSRSKAADTSTIATRSEFDSLRYTMYLEDITQQIRKQDGFKGKLKNYVKWFNAFGYQFGSIYYLCDNNNKLFDVTLHKLFHYSFEDDDAKDLKKGSLLLNVSVLKKKLIDLFGKPTYSKDKESEKIYILQGEKVSHDRIEILEWTCNNINVRLTFEFAYGIPYQIELKVKDSIVYKEYEERRRQKLLKDFNN